MFIIAPIATFILYLANKINQRIENTAENSAEARKEISDKLDLLQKQSNDLERRFERLELELSLKMQAMQFSVQQGVTESGFSGKTRHTYNKYKHENTDNTEDKDK